MKSANFSFIPILIFVILFSNSGIAQNQGAPEYTIELDRDTIFEGDCFLYTVTLNNLDPNEVPDFRKLEGDFQVVLRDRQNVSSSFLRSDSFGIEKLEINNGIKYRYELTPKKTGKLTIPPPKLTFKGEDFHPSRILLAQSALMKHLDPVQNATVEVTIIPQDQQDNVYLELSTDRADYYPLQPINVKIEIFLKGFPGEFSEENPMIIQNRSKPGTAARVTIPWLDDSLLPPGLRPQSNLETWITPYIAVSPRNEGFFINRFRDRSFFSANDGAYIFFRPPFERIKRPDKDGNEVEYWKYTFSRAYQGDRIGQLELGECIFQGVLPIFDPDDTKKVIPFNAFVKSDPVVIEIKDAPEEGRPETFLGAFGKFTWTAEMSSREGRLGDPLTLRLKLSGRGTLKNLKPPALDQNEEILEKFKPYPPSENFTERGNNLGCTFTYSIRPQKEGEQEFPGIPFTFFDVESEKFVTLLTDPIPLRILPADPLKSVPATTTRGEEGELELYKDGIFANMLDISGARGQTIAPYPCFVLFAVLVFVYPLLALAVFTFRRLGSDTVFLRRRNAFPKAKSLWKEGSFLLAQGQTDSGFSKFYSSIASFLADMTGASEAALASNDIIRILENNAVAPNTVEYVRKLLETFEAARYGDIPVAHSLDSIARASLTVIETLDKHFRKRKPDSRVTGIAAIVLCLLPIISGCTGAANPEDAKIFVQAQELFDNAGNEETKDTKEIEAAYRDSALKYQDLIDSGVSSGPIFYNQGNAWFRAGEKGRALASYRQAQRYLPGNPYLNANIVAILGIESDRRLYGWVRYCFFFQDWISYANKLRLLSLGACLSFLLGVVWIFRPRKWTRRIALFVFCCTLLMCGAAVYDWYHFDHLRYGVTISSETILRKGNADHYEPVFTDKLPEATEFLVLEQRGEWIQCRLYNGQNGWMRINDAEIY